MIFLLAEATQSSSLLSIVAGSGPVAGVLLAAVYALWKDNREIREKLDEKNAEQVQFLKELLNDLE